MKNKDILLRQQEELEAQLKQLQATMKLVDSLNEVEEILTSNDVSNIQMSLTINTETGKASIKDMPTELVEEIKTIILAYDAYDA
jgi:hypothetical protein